MTAQARVAPVPQSTPAVALPGSWKLARGRAVTLRPAADGIVRVAHGRIWATVEGPHGGTPCDSGDHVLEVGRSMVVRAGQRVVLEAWNASGASYFGWEPAPAARTMARRRLDAAAVTQPLADLRLAAGMALRALGSLAGGLAPGLGLRAGRQPPGRQGPARRSGLRLELRRGCQGHSTMRNALR